MKKVDWNNLELAEGVSREPSPDASQLVLWLRGDLVNGFQEWERIANVPGVQVVAKDGVCQLQATAVRAHHKERGLLGRLFRTFQKSDASPGWLLPNGEKVQQIGARESDRVFVWVDDESTALDEQNIRERFGANCAARRVASKLFVVWNMEPAAKAIEEPSDLPDITPLEQAEKSLAEARESGDFLKQASPLIDLGVICLRGGKVPQAVQFLQQALAIAQRFGDQTLESDAQTNLAAALFAAGQPEKASELLEAELVRAREANDRYHEKTVLGHLAAVRARLRDVEAASQLFSRAIALARELGDRNHEADLLWYLAIANAEWGRREQTLAAGGAAIQILKQQGSPIADEYSRFLEKYRLEDSGPGMSLSPSSAHADAATIQNQQVQGPSLLRMAMSAAKSAGLFLAAGLKTLPKETIEKRLESCAACPHHTGVRCKVCGCFTKVKARLPHEKCPLAKWSAA